VGRGISPSDDDDDDDDDDDGLWRTSVGNFGTPKPKS
jgi:hypothetical protein